MTASRKKKQRQQQQRRGEKSEATTTHRCLGYVTRRREGRAER